MTGHDRTRRGKKETATTVIVPAEEVGTHLRGLTLSTELEHRQKVALGSTL